MKYLVDFKHSATESDIQSYLSTNGCTVLKEWDNFDKVFLVETSVSLVTTDIIERLTEDEGLKIKPLDILFDPYHGTHKDPNQEDIVITVNDQKDWWKNYSYRQPEFEKETLTIKRKGKGISVYVMDSGLDATHPEFADATISNIYSVTPNDYTDNNGHGTALSSVIVGKTCGITNAHLKVVKIFDPNHETLQSEFLSALDAIIADHVDNTWAVLNCSWIIAKNEYVEHKLRILEDEGVFIMAAAGNGGSSIEDVTPAGMIDAVTVGAYDSALEPCDFSNYTDPLIHSITQGATNHGELDGWAPGKNIYAAQRGGGYGMSSGTSIATAVASAVLVSNISNFSEENGERWDGYQNVAVSTAAVDNKKLLFIRPDMLSLDDPKYAESLNLIATLSDKSTVSISQSPDTHEIIVRVGQEKVGRKLIEPSLTKSMTWIQPLPENFKMLKDGRLHSQPVASQAPGPNDSQPYTTYNSSFERTLLDDTVDVVSITIYVLPENLDTGTLPQSDPVIQVSLQDACTGFGELSCGIGSTFRCFDSCQFGSNCCAPFNGSKSVPCTCLA